MADEIQIGDMPWPKSVLTSCSSTSTSYGSEINAGDIVKIEAPIIPFTGGVPTKVHYPNMMGKVIHIEHLEEKVFIECPGEGSGGDTDGNYFFFSLAEVRPYYGFWLPRELFQWED